MGSADGRVRRVGAEPFFDVEGIIEVAGMCVFPDGSCPMVCIKEIVGRGRKVGDRIVVDPAHHGKVLLEFGQEGKIEVRQFAGDLSGQDVGHVGLGGDPDGVETEGLDEIINAEELLR